MCGICGVFRPDGGPVDPERVVRMRDAMTPRGPDGFGLEHGPGFALGHRRLSIIDLSDAGHQPMSNEDDSVWLVFNGEIYNHLDLRPQLEAAGHRFRSRTDSEVLIHGYEQWGLEELLRRIRGMYAIVLVDRRDGSIHMARDPLGKKPLFFQWADGELLFSSSARSLALGLSATPEIDPVAVDALLWSRYIPGPRTIFVGVQKLPPASLWSLNRAGEVREAVYWQPDFRHPQAGVDDEEWLERIEATLTIGVKRRLMADVPLGVMLSGGVDSSLVTALAAKCTGRLQTFSVANEDPRYDESAYAEAVAQRYGTDHHVLPVRTNVREDLPHLVAAMGEPLADASAINLFAIAKMARQAVTVILTGDGGDEAFGGYTEAFAAHHAQRIQRFLPRAIRPCLAGLAAFMQRGPAMVRRPGTLLRMSASPLEDSFGLLGPWDSRWRNDLYTPEFRGFLGPHYPLKHYRSALAETEGMPWADRVMQTHMTTLLPDDFLAKVDYATMGASLEARCPFLGLDLLDLAMQIPAETRFRGRQPKGLLRSLARRHLPKAGVDRPKQGFSASVDLWFQGRWNDLVDDLILGPHVEQRGWFRRQSLQRLVDEQLRGIQHGNLLWALLVLELWIRQAAERTLNPADTLPRNVVQAAPLG
jgi:asparagine synthase (glutamine-hydrolysing)